MHSRKNHIVVFGIAGTVFAVVACTPAILFLLVRSGLDARKSAEHVFEVDETSYLVECVAVEKARETLVLEGYHPDEWSLVKSPNDAVALNGDVDDVYFFRNTDPKKGFVSFVRESDGDVVQRLVCMRLEGRRLHAFVWQPK